MALGIKFWSSILSVFLFIVCFKFGETVLSHNYYGLRESFEEEIPEGASTLAFVFDITGSMYDDLVQVIEGAARILSTILARREKAIYNYVLVPFHDPDIGPVTVTTDPDLFQRQLKELYVQGGGDCPEMSVGAIKLALEVCLPNSHIYVFTDARAKDYYLLNDVLKLIQRKQSQVVFVMTGDCGNHSHPGYQAYERIASTSSGQVFHLMKSDVDEVLNFVRVSLQARKVNLFAIDRHAGDMREFEFDVDGSLREFTISVSGENPVVTIINSKGEVVDQRKGLLDLLNHKNISIVNIKDPEPGRWKIRVNSEGSHTIRATGLSNIDFVHGFSRQPTANLKETYHRPLKGAPTFLLVNATDLPDPATFKNVRIVDLEGNNLQNIPLHRFPGSNLFNASTFYPPNEYFYLKVAGSDEHGYPIERMTSTAISAQLPDAPEVNTRPYMNGYYDEDTDLRCYIQSLVPFSVTWYKDGVQISQQQHFPQTTEVVLTVPEVTLLSEGYYSCNATNIAGRHSSVIFLDVKEPPPSISSTGNVSGIVGKTAVLPCEVHSIVDYNVTWTKLVADEKNIGYVKAVPLPDVPRFLIYSNNSLAIKNLLNDDEGWYRCKAANDGGAVQENIYLHAYEPPVVNVKPPIKNFVSGDFVNISCQADGYPEPLIRWIWSPAHNQNFISGKSEIREKNLLIYSAEADDEGRYDCIATNIAGTQVATAVLNYIEAPFVSLPAEELTVKNGEQAVLRCIAEGIPDPKVKWYKGSVEIQPLSYIQVSPDGSLLIYDVQETDAGKYTCVAVNEAGTANETMYLNVGSKPFLIKLPSSASVEILQNISIPCIATGTPNPQISWHFGNGSNISTNSKFAVSSEGTLIIRDADLSVAGKYICRAQNRFGTEEQSLDLVITGIRKPILSPLPEILEVPKGEKKSVSCIVLDGNPKPHLTWFRNGQLLQTGYGLKIDDGRLEILKADDLHEANYSCFASNIGGNATEEMYLNILYHPEIYPTNQEFVVTEGSDITMSCNVKGDPKPAILWYKDNIQLIPNDEIYIENDGSLKIKNVRSFQEGEYICSATNIVGTSDQSMKLIVKVPPRIIHPVSSYNVTEGNIATLNCNVYAKPPAFIKWKRLKADGEEENLEKYIMYNGSLQIRANYADEGLYVCEAENEVGHAQSEMILNVHVPPLADIKAPATIVAIAGHPLSLACEAFGHPPPKTYWTKDGIILQSSESLFVKNGNFTIFKTSLSDEGTYSCVGENLVGRSEVKRTVTIHEKPKISSVYSSAPDIFATIGDKVDIICNASAYPIPEIIWTEPENGLVHYIQNEVLHIPFIQEKDAGIYTCTAKNTAGFDKKSFNLTVYAPPLLTTNPSRKIEIIKDGEITLDCSASGIPPPEIIWYKNNEGLSASEHLLFLENDQKLKIIKADISDAGQYSCVARNLVGETSNTFKLGISDPPKFTKPHVETINVLKNSSAILDCTAEGHPEPILIWRKNQQIISSAVNSGFKYENSKNILYINYLQESDAGIYSCVAMNKVGSVTRDFEVSVLVRPEIHGTEFGEKEVLLHQVSDFHCLVSGNPFPTITWYKDGKEIIFDNYEKFIDDDHQKLTLLKPEEPDSGIYTCIASSEIGEARKDIKLNVLVPPHIKDQTVTETFRIKEGQDIFLKCEAYGNPAPKILWIKNNAPVSLTNSVNNSIFVITNATKRDGGRYICTATNKAGSYEKDFNIVILSPPKLENSYKMPNKYSKKGQKEVLKNMPVELICPFSGDPLPQYVWMKDGNILDPNTNSFAVMSNGGKHLKIKHAKAEDAGKYICIAKNEVGEARHEYDIDVLVPPSITSEYASSLSLRERESLTLNCNTTGNPSPFVIWLKDGVEVEAKDDDLKFSFSNMNLEIADVKSYHSGKYICIATNLAGSTEKEFNVDVLTPPHLNLEQEEAVGRPTAYVNKPVSLECPISGNPLPQISWMKNGKHIKLEEEQNIYVHDDGRKISILRAKEDDTGLYKCVADNAVGSSAYVFDLEILVPPTIDRRKLQKVYFVKEGGSVTIKCPVSGHPKPIITWLKDSDVIPLHSSPHIHFSYGFQNLRLKYASLRDAGRYICIAGNEIGTAEQDFKVDVQVPPKLENLVEKDKNKSSVLNKPVTISCPVSGIPPPVVQWYKNNSILNTAADPNIRLSSDSRHLKIIRTRISDAGIYKCKAANDVGKIEEEFSLDVQIPPKIMETNSVIDYYSEDEDEGKSDLKASENSTVELDCYVDGNPRPAIIWIKDGYLVNDTNHYKVSSNGQLMQVNHITTSDAGHYTCIASNIAGTKEKNFILDVLVPPKIKGPNYESHSLLPNRPAVIECAVDANPPPSVTWLKNGNIVNVSQYDLVKIIEDGKMLQFLKTNSNHDGIYTCIAENSIGKAEKNFKVDVFVSPVIQDAHFESEIMENEKVSMDCVSYGNPKPNIIWLRDGQIISEDLLRNLSIDKLENGFHLKIAEVKMYHTGNYKCIATNIVGSAEKSFDIYVKVFPRITNTSEPNMTVFIHQPVAMYCIAEAEPEASVAWIKDGHIIREDIDPFINILDDGQKLQILRARESDDGQYSCEVSNAEGNDSRSFVLNVLVPPRVKNIIQEDSRTHVVEGNSTDIQCYVHGNPLPIVSWMKDGKVLISGKAERLQLLENNQLLHIANVQTEDGGRYTCIASSPLGTEERHFDLFVQVPPKIYDDLNADYIAHLNKPLIIHCEAEGNPKPVVTWMKNGVFLEPFADPNLHFLKEDSALLIRLARIEDSGKYTCVASSSAGQDERNFDIRVHTPASIDKENLKHDLLTVINQTIVLQCPAFGIPSPAVSWLKDGEVLHSSVDSKHQILEGGKILKVNFAKQSDEGKYSCIAFNDAGTDTAEFIVDVMIPPQMSPLMSQQELKAHEGESVILTCPLIDSNYTHTITWEKNGRKFSSGTTQPHIEFSPDNKKIRIMKSQAQDTGIYTCVVSNSAGTTEYEMNVLVLVPARIDYPADKMTSTYVKEHHSITLECVALGHPQPTLTWFKNGLPLLEHYNATFLSSGKLKIFDASTYDTSVYSCLAQNEAGIDERSYNLTVYVPPLINVSSHGLHKVSLQNTEITLGCPATGIPSPRVIWYKGSQMLLPGPRISFSKDGEHLKISHVTAADAGKYVCLAVNEAGDTEAEHFVKVHVPPVIEEASIYGLPDPVVNQSVRIYCDIQGLPFPKISWYKNGALIDQNHKRFSSSGGGRYLDILSIKISDSGTYTCQAENIAGQAKKDIQLSVSVPPDIDEKGKSKEYQVILGKPLRIDCEASGTPPPSITWLKNGLPLTEKDHVQLVNNNYALLFTYTLPDEAGVYTCIATNNAGSVEQKFNLTVLVPPVLNNFKNGDNLSIVAGSSNKLYCSAQGIPMPDIVWSKDNNIISNSEAVHIEDGILEILETDISHNGTYVCEASNVAGKVTKSFDLIVNMPPKIERSDETTFITSSVKESVDIDCVVHGIPPPTVLWFRNKMPILSSFLSAYHISNQGAKLTIRNADLKDSGNYMCVATNSAGNDTKDFVLNILEPPTIKDTAPLIKTQVGNKIALECSVVGVPPPEISWLKENSLLLLDDSESSIFGKNELYFDNVKLQHAGNYSCIAVNEAGVDRKDFVLQVSAPPVIEDNETHQKILAGDSVSLQCLASGYPTPLIMWHKDSILIQNNKDHQILPDDTLHIPKTNLSHTGTYKCLAENEAGSQEAIRRLTVLSPPKIAELSPDRYETTQAHPVILQCSANGEPQPSISWEHNGVSLDLYNPRFKVFPSGDLHISLTQSSDMGTYTCIAKNEAGSATRNIDLIVLVPPVVTINGANTIVAIKGRSVTITCSAVGFPPPHISWQKSGGAVLDSTISDLSRELALHNIQPEDSGNYVCIASNCAGRDHQSVTLDVHVPPVITTLPKSQDISVGDILSLHCEASGHPIPSITWLLNNTQVTGSVHSILGRSKLHIQNVSKEDEGTYICLAQNAAGERKAAAAVRVRAPPVILDSSGVKSVQVKEAVILDCLVKGDPSPNIIWIKNGQRLELNHRIQVMMNGSLFIYNSSDQDSGHYKCIASNDFGSAERTAELIVKSRPTFIIEPHNTKTEVGNTVHFDCRLDGEPKPTVAWMKDSVLLQKDARILTFPNNTLQLIAVQQSDEGVYTCFGNNSLGSAAAEAQLIVQVHGKWSNWQEWGQCSASCGDGEQSRQRFCNDPAPKNGGKTCIGLSNEIKKCNERPCPVNGEWGNWLEWEQCSASCGIGQRKRQRKCDNPSPQYGGENCTGLGTETDTCILTKCPVDGRWSMWSDWQPCSVSCGKGIQIRIRECKNPEPLHGGQPCIGEGEESQECVLDECAVHGEWGAWNEWSLCSSSCGGGTRERIRLCDSPAPAFGGHYCTGSHIQTDYCNNAQCPINGGWGQWSSWGECSSSCNKGQKKRFRSCDNPTPAGGGRDCLGPSQEVEVCNAFLCPVDGKWGEWSFWSVCSVTCGIGVRSRVRHCDSPDPSYGGKDCLGDNEEFEECGDEACDVAPVQAKGHLIGVINGIDFGLSKLSANITQSGIEFLVSADIQNITEEIAVWMKLLVPLLNPIYWTTAYEVGDAVNGYTLTKGLFRRETQVNFVTGEILSMTHVARGLDKRGNLLVDIVISGEIPDIPTASTVILHPYFEDYIQTGPGSLYAFSTCTYKIGNYVLPYSWNHTIFYDETQGQMPYVVERLYANGIDCSFDADKQEIKFTISASISKGYSDECFEGFILSEDGKYCNDIDECEPNNPCSQICSNFPGGFSCLCVNGFALDVDGETCNDVNECDLNIARCSSTEECVNIIGSYKCLVVCKKGYERSADEQYCLDVDECSSNLHKCSQICINNIGSYSCSCENGYHLLNGVDCIDTDECTLNASCMHICMNIPGSFLCSCYAGYELQSGSNCIDIDECYHGIYNCPEDQECMNIDGGYECIDTCLSGFFRAVNGSCLDIDECHEGLAACHFTQLCINTYGSYHCSCLRGYYSDGPGKPCQDINECLQRPRPCSYLCRNLPGDYECVCAPGFKRLSDAKTCVGIEYLDELNLEVQHDFINPERNRSSDLFSESNVPSKDEAISYCETGFYKVKGECKDIDECEDKGKCQHLCENIQGSYRCICPAGYHLGPTGKTCEDIDECLESNIECGASRMCFNMRGSFKCIETPCPPDYDRDPLTGYCKLSCENAGTACPPNVKYSEILAFKMIALPSGIQAYQDLIRLVAYDQDGVQLPNTVFSIIENNTGLPFRIRLENGKGVLYTQKSMDSNTDYQIKVQAVSYDMENHIIQYTTKFLVFISVSKHPY